MGQASIKWQFSIPPASTFFSHLPFVLEGYSFKVTSWKLQQTFLFDIQSAYCTFHGKYRSMDPTSEQQIWCFVNAFIVSVIKPLAACSCAIYSNKMTGCLLIYGSNYVCYRGEKVKQSTHLYTLLISSFCILLCYQVKPGFYTS